MILFPKRIDGTLGFAAALFAVCFFFVFAIVAFAQQTPENEVSAVVKQDPAKKQGPTDLSKRQSRGFLEAFDLLNWRANRAQPDKGNKIRTVSLYPQSFSEAKPTAYQTTPPRSYLLSLDDRDKENAIVGLANIDSQDKTEIKSIYPKDLSAELLVGYRWSGFGSILFGGALQYDNPKENVGGHLSDMGWRIKFVKTF